MSKVSWINTALSTIGLKQKSSLSEMDKSVTLTRVKGSTCSLKDSAELGETWAIDTSDLVGTSETIDVPPQPAIPEYKIELFRGDSVHGEPIFETRKMAEQDDFEAAIDDFRAKAILSRVECTIKITNLVTDAVWSTPVSTNDPLPKEATLRLIMVPYQAKPIEGEVVPYILKPRVREYHGIYVRELNNQAYDYFSRDCAGLHLSSARSQLIYEGLVITERIIVEDVWIEPLPGPSTVKETLALNDYENYMLAVDEVRKQLSDPKDYHCPDGYYRFSIPSFGLRDFGKDQLVRMLQRSGWRTVEIVQHSDRLDFELQP